MSQSAHSASFEYICYESTADSDTKVVPRTVRVTDGPRVNRLEFVLLADQKFKLFNLAF